MAVVSPPGDDEIMHWFIQTMAFASFICVRLACWATAKEAWSVMKSKGKDESRFRVRTPLILFVLGLAFFGIYMVGQVWLTP